MLRFAFVLCVFLPSLALACDEEDGPEPVPQHTDTELWKTYEVAWAGFDDERRALLDRAQRAWMEFRQANCELLADRLRFTAPESFAECFAFMTGERTMELSVMGRTAEPDAACDL
jgi:uncharacterized protein YecT (DUF1311 family)